VLLLHWIAALDCQLKLQSAAASSLGFSSIVRSYLKLIYACCSIDGVRWPFSCMSSAWGARRAAAATWSGAGGPPADASSVVPGDEQGRVALMQSYHHAIEGFGSDKAGSTQRVVACTRMLCGLRGPPRVPAEAMRQEAGCRVCPHDGSRRMQRRGGQPQPAPLASVCVCPDYGPNRKKRAGRQVAGAYCRCSGQQFRPPKLIASGRRRIPSVPPPPQPAGHFPAQSPQSLARSVLVS
jgi:hypothetical protein